jgi:hypothetical protein
MKPGPKPAPGERIFWGGRWYTEEQLAKHKEGVRRARSNRSPAERTRIAAYHREYLKGDSYLAYEERIAWRNVRFHDGRYDQMARAMMDAGLTLFEHEKQGQQETFYVVFSPGRGRQIERLSDPLPSW